MKIRIAILAAAALFMLALSAGCSTAAPSVPASTQAAPPSRAPSASPAVFIANFIFAPPTMTVAVGATVTWKNSDLAAHTVTSDTGAWDSGDITQGNTFSHTFTEPGDFPYHCKHHTSMTGTVVVQ